MKKTTAIAEIKTKPNASKIQHSSHFTEPLIKLKIKFIAAQKGMEKSIIIQHKHKQNAFFQSKMARLL